MSRWKDEGRTLLALLRSKAGFSREDAAAVLKVVAMTLYRYEIGKNDIPLGTAEDMAVLYKISFDDLRKASRETKELYKVRHSKEMK